MLIKLPYRKAMPKICWQHYQILLRPAGVSQSAGCRQMAALLRQGRGSRSRGLSALQGLSDPES